jgi:hypothetical protein
MAQPPLTDIVGVLLNGTEKAPRAAAEAALVCHQRHSPVQYCLDLAALAGADAHGPHGLQAMTLLAHFVRNSGWRAVKDAAHGDAALLPRVRQPLLLLAGGTLLGRAHARKCSDAIATIFADDLLREWPTGLTDLHAAIEQSTHREHRLQLLLVLHECLKESRRKAVDADAFAAAFAPLTPVAFGWLAATYDAAAGDAADIEAFVLCSKICLRLAAVYACDGPTVVECASLSNALAAGIVTHGATGTRMKALERVSKIVTKAMENHPSEAPHVAPGFLASAFFPFVRSVAQHSGATAQSGAPLPGAMTAKLVVRVFTACGTLLECAACDPVIGGAVEAFFTGDVLRDVMTNVTKNCLHDEFIDAAEWAAEPEQFVIEADVEADPDDLAQCASALLLHLVDAGGAAGVAAAWEVLLSLLDSPRQGDVVAALHGIGAGCYVLADGQVAAYDAFLHAKLLPVVTGAVAAGPVLQRRVVWVIGQWCESVEAQPVRAEIHAALGDLLAAPATDLVVRLTALRTIKHFAIDMHFAAEDMLTGDTVPKVLAAIGGVIPQLRNPAMVGEIAGLVFLVGEKTNGALVAADSIVALFTPVLLSLLAALHDFDRQAVAAVAAVCQALASAVVGCATPALAWDALVQPCLGAVSPDSEVACFVDDAAWSVLFALARAATDDMRGHAGVAATLDAVLPALDRDSECLPVVVRTVAALVFFVGDAWAAERVAALAGKALELMARWPVDEAVDAVGVLLDTLLTQWPHAVAPLLFRPCLERVLAADVEEGGAEFAVSAAVVARVTLLNPAAWQGVAPAEAAAYVDQLAMGVDYITASFQCRLVVCGLAELARTAAPAQLGPDERGLVAQVVEGEVLKEFGVTPLAMVTEMWGVEETPCAHLARLAAAVAADPVASYNLA